MVTRLITVSAASRPLTASTTATPVMTSCVRPQSVWSIARASAASAGLPSARPSMTTIVSAPSTTSAGRIVATALALRRARRLTASGSGTASRVSSTSLGTISNATPSEASSSRRRGEAEARVRLRDDQRVRVRDDARLGVDRGPDVLGDAEGVLVREPVPIAEARCRQPLGDELVDDLGRLRPGIDLLCGGDEPPRRAEARDERLVGGHDRKDLAQRAMDRREKVELAELGHTRLQRHRAARRQTITHERVELLRKEEARWPFFQGLDEVDRDEVEPLGRALQVRPGILVADVGTGVLEHALVHLRQVLLAELDHFAVDVDHDAAADARIPQDLAQGRAFTTTDDQTGLRRAIAREHARVHERLVVDEVLRLARLDPPVEDQELAVRRRLHDLGVLELGLQLGDGPLDGVHVALDRRRGLEEPFVGLRTDQLTATALLTIGTAELRNMPR